MLTRLCPACQLLLLQIGIATPVFLPPPRYRRNTDVKPTCDFAALKKVSDSGHK